MRQLRELKRLQDKVQQEQVKVTPAPVPTSATGPMVATTANEAKGPEHLSAKLRELRKLPAVSKGLESRAMAEQAQNIHGRSRTMPPNLGNVIRRFAKELHSVHTLP